MTIMSSETNLCAICNQPIQGRIDKRFCSAQCRATLHNHRRKEDMGERIITDINRILRKNRSILKTLSPLGKTTIKKEYLELQGFDFTHYTHQYRTQRGNLYYFCYEFGYMLLPEDKVLIVNWQEYMGPMLTNDSVK